MQATPLAELFPTTAASGKSSRRGEQRDAVTVEDENAFLQRMLIRQKANGAKTFRSSSGSYSSSVPSIGGGGGGGAASGAAAVASGALGATGAAGSARSERDAVRKERREKSSKLTAAVAGTGEQAGEQELSEFFQSLIHLKVSAYSFFFVSLFFVCFEAC